MSYANILTRLINTPLLIEAGKLDIITQNVSLKLLAGDYPTKLLQDTQNTPESKVITTEDFALISIHGSLVNKNGMGDSGIASYASLANQIDNLDKKLVIFDISSFGGEAAGLFPLAEKINSLKKKRIKSIGYTDSMATSAAYALMAACEECYAVDTADIGSIGAVLSLVDVTKMDEKMGISYTILRSKDEKALYNPHEGMSKEVMEKAKKKLMQLDEKFNESIMKFRNVSLNTLVDLKGNSISAKEALDLKLIDGIVTNFDELVSNFKVSNNPTQVFVTNKQSNIKTEVVKMNIEEELAKTKLELMELKSSMSLEIASAKMAERNRVLKIIDSAKTFGLSESAIVNSAIMQDMSLETVAAVFTDVAQAKDAALQIAGVSTLGSANAGMREDLVKNGKLKSFDDEVSEMMKSGIDNSAFSMI